MILKIATLNVNGFNHNAHLILRFITLHNLHILCIQETHHIQNHIISHFAQHKLQIISNTDNNTLHKHGTAIIINHNVLSIPKDCIDSHVIIPNRIHFINISFNNVNYLIFNLYLPSGNLPTNKKDRIHNIKTLKSFMELLEIKNKLIFITGDFNLVLEKIDRVRDFRSFSNDVILFRSLISNFDLVDAYRSLYPFKSIYTFSRTHPTSRLDRIYLPASALSQLSESTHLHISFSDHCLSPVIHLKTLSPTTSRSAYWKLNNSILFPHINHLSIKTTINTLLQPSSQLSNPLDSWDSFKKKIKKFLISISIWTKQRQTRRKQYLEKQLLQSISRQDSKQIILIQEELEKFENQKKQGNEIRSRIQINTSIDNPHPLATIQETNLQQKSQTPTPTHHLFFDFFQNLWNPNTSSPDPTDYLSDIQPLTNHTILSTLPQSPLITVAEVRVSIEMQNKRSSPGYDGLTPTFYSLHPSLAPVLTQTFNNSFLKSELSPSQRQALIKLVPKQPKPTSVKHWRPISLLNTDYKILSTIIANRLKPLLNEIISPEQQCGLPKRQIFNNHLNIKSAIDFANDFSQPLAIIQIDFYKAFDSISHTFLLQTAQKLGIPPSLLKWIQVFLTNLTAKLNLNGCLSHSIPVTRGIRQGCPLSMLLFIIGIEPLTRKILSSSEIQGITLGKSSLKVTHFADDLTLFITHPSSFSKLREILMDFSFFSGLNINDDKTTIISNSPSLLSSFKSTFPQGNHLSSSKILGIYFSFKPEEMARNWDDIVRSAPHTFFKLNPNDSLFSKVISINEHFLPKILFLSRILPPTANHIKALTTSLFKFLWNFSTFEALKRSQLYLSKPDGGIGLPSIGAKASTALLWQFVYLLNLPSHSLHFWTYYSIYNLGSLIRPFKLEFYSNSEPHRPNPNPYWKQILSLLSKTKINPSELHSLSFKSLYSHLLNTDPFPLPSKTGTPSNRHSWLRLTLFQPKPSLFSNFEKEVAFRTACKGYTWGCFFQKHLFQPRTPTDFLCKLCLSSSDDPYHLFYECHHTKHLINHLQKYITRILGQPTLLTRNVLLFNYTNLPPTPHLLLTKLSSLLRVSLISLRQQTLSFNISINKNLLNETLFKIKTKFKTFLSELDPP